MSELRISAEMVKRLRELTGAGIMDCKEALLEAGGDIEGAMAILRRKGIAKAEKKRERETREGLIVSYIHGGGRLGVLLELNCETDFVARTEEFAKLSKDIAMHIAAMNPRYISRKDVPEEVLDKKRKEIMEEIGVDDDEEAIKERMEEFFSEVCLLDQMFIKDMSMTVGELIDSYIAKFGENIVVRRYVRFELGGS
jgi:elongation factor Ts